uniref:Uncharacterized protein n=2 Tax=Candidatus Kentrum sp. FM TaxID=2126340 RepID=A0A450T0T1_9GAMM|nr:MAG: hypothetical protein BECKFM1743A_GA0114220_102561 [Candidatus Kentron sp. FM]
MVDRCNYPSEIDMDARMLGGEHLGSPVRSPERRGESCIRPLCPIRPYAQKLRLHRAILLSGHFLFFVNVFWFHVCRTTDKSL